MTNNRFKQYHTANTSHSTPHKQLSSVNSFDEDDVDFADPYSVYHYGLNVVTGELPTDDSIEMAMYVNAVRELTEDLNNFDSTKNNCAICGGKGHTFADCPELNSDSCKLREAYLKIRLAANRFRKAINHIDQFHGNKYNGDMNLLRSCRLSQLNANMTELPAHILSSVSGFDESRIDRMEDRINSVTTAVSRTGNVVLDIHRVLTSTRGAGDDDSSLQSISSLNDFLADQPDFRKAAQQK